MDNSDFIDKVKKHISHGHKDFPSNTSQFLEIVRRAIAEKTATPEQQAQLAALEKELAELLTQAREHHDVGYCYSIHDGELMKTCIAEVSKSPAMCDSIFDLSERELCRARAGEK